MRFCFIVIDVAAPGRSVHHPGITPGRVICGDRDNSPMAAVFAWLAHARHPEKARMARSCADACRLVGLPARNEEARRNQEDRKDRSMAAPHSWAWWADTAISWLWSDMQFSVSMVSPSPPA